MPSTCPGRNHQRALQHHERARGFPVPHRAIHTLADLENITSAGVPWYNEHRLRRRPPAEADASHYAHRQVGMHTDHR